MTGRGSGRGVSTRPVPAVSALASMSISAPPALSIAPTLPGTGRGTNVQRPKPAGPISATMPAPLTGEPLSGNEDRRRQNFEPGRFTYRVPDRFRERHQTRSPFEKEICHEGKEVQLTTNYFSMQETALPHVYQVSYLSVNFEPFIDKAAERRIIMEAMTCLRGKEHGYYYDGRGSLFLAADRRRATFGDNLKISEPFNHRPLTKDDTRITLIYHRDILDAKELREWEWGTMHGVLNMIFARILTEWKKEPMVQIDDGFYMLGRTTEITGLSGLTYQYKLFDLPGYKPVLQQYDCGLLLNVDLCSKYLRSGSVLTAIQSACPKQHAMGSVEHCAAATNILKGLIIITTYNSLAYKIMEVTGTQTVSSLFKHNMNTRTKDGGLLRETKELTIEGYLQKIYVNSNIKITNKVQPLILCRKISGDKDRRPLKGADQRLEWVPLVPELCLLTGLTDDLKTNMSNWNKILDSARKEPGKRSELVRQFAVKLDQDVVARETLAKWALTMGVNLEDVIGRELPLVELAQDIKSVRYERKDADWTKNLRDNRLDDPKSANKLVIVYPHIKEPLAEKLLNSLNLVGKKMGIAFEKPLTLPVSGGNPKDYATALENMPDIQNADIVVCMLPDNLKERYNEIKMLTTETIGVPTQCILAKNVDGKSAMSIITKVALQMNAKMGGALWRIRNPAVQGKGVMVIGTTIGRGINFNGKKAVAFVATVNDHYSSFINEAAIIEEGGIPGNVYKDIMQALIKGYKLVNHGSEPEIVILYRTMDSEADMFEVMDNTKGELTYCQHALAKCSPKSKLLFCVALKKCSSRFFAAGPSNPQPGTIVDQKVTVPGRNDFYLISHNSKKGTVMPTYYFNVWDETEISHGDFQALTFQMCHMYYNWSGIIKIPAVCQYAHKMATMIGEVTHKQAHEKLNRKLWYL